MFKSTLSNVDITPKVTLFVYLGCDISSPYVSLEKLPDQRRGRFFFYFCNKCIKHRDTN